MSITNDSTYQAECAAAADARQDALLAYFFKGVPTDRATFIRDTDAIFAEYHKRLFAAIDGARLRLDPGNQYGLPPVVGNPSLN